MEVKNIGHIHVCDARASVERAAGWNGGAAIKPARGGLPPRRLRLVRDHIEAELASRVRLRDLAVVARLSPFHFCRAFRQSTGMTPHQYVIARRIGRAKELLAESRLPIAAIALEAGFSSQRQLNAHFARAVRATPRRFRQAS